MDIEQLGFLDVAGRSYSKCEDLGGGEDSQHILDFGSGFDCSFNRSFDRSFGCNFGCGFCINFERAIMFEKVIMSFVGL